MEPAFEPPEESIFRRRNRRPTPLTVELSYLTAIVVGILAKEIWDSLNATGAIHIAWVRLIAALVVAPIVFAAISARFQRQRIALADLALAFQHGFFWRTIFGQPGT